MRTEHTLRQPEVIRPILLEDSPCCGGARTEPRAEHAEGGLLVALLEVQRQGVLEHGQAGTGAQAQEGALVGEEGHGRRRGAGGSTQAELLGGGSETNRLLLDSALLEPDS